MTIYIPRKIEINFPFEWSQFFVLPLFALEINQWEFVIGAGWLFWHFDIQFERKGKQ